MTGVKGDHGQTTGTVRCEQEVAGGRDVYVVPLPAVVTVKEGLNLPRYPSVPGRLRAKRKPLDASTPGATGRRGSRWSSSRSRRARASRCRCSATAPSAAPAVVAVLSELGLV